ncbi:VWA domain-containing protein [Candidatus Woesearchaeota archaeon]|nr:VWA domain-containing protein [Candidatus Woesearchaeota archaeon]MBW3016117.1 VWA domain-containing protein [Candidatus Woesearchaeota archaeon]
MSATDVLRWAYAHMEYPYVLLAILVLIPLIWWLLRREFLVLKEEPSVKLQKRRLRRFMFVTRSLMVILVVIALASPYVQREKIIEGDPFIQLLVDNSTSMSVFEDVSAQLASRLEKKMNTEVKVVGTGSVSNIGDSVLASLEPHSSVLLFSDGNVNSGADLGDVALYASKLNATINAVRLNPIKNDAGVVVFGPSKTLEDSENTFTVVVNRVGNIKSVPVKVMLDDEVVYDQTTDQSAFQFTRQLAKGTHKITASVSVDDFFPKNNVFYKTVKVVPKPKILLYSEKSSPLEVLLKQLYEVDVASRLPASLQDYYAVVVNDIKAETVDPVSDVVNDFVADGNGLVVFGGENSYDKGDYRNSVFETMLPVMVGAPEKKPGDVLIAVVIDVSGSQGAPFGRFTSTADFSKSATIDIMHNLKIDTRVAIIAFNTQAYLISEPSPVFAKQGVEDLIGRLKWGGGTNIGAGLLKALSVLGQFSGSKNIVLLSDGKTQSPASAYEAAKFAANSGFKIYTVGVGPTTDEQVMMDIADITNGIYFRATEESRLKILFGPVDEQEAQSGQMELVVLNKNHFITENFEPSAVLYGYNQASPKGAARLLATTSTGEPVLTVWRLGLGRVAAFTVDDGSKWAGSMLGKPNSRLIARTLNWAIGDPERKSASFIDAKDTRLFEPAEITVKSDVPPQAENVVFYKIDEDTYVGSLLVDQTGFQSVAGAVFAVNYESEFEGLGMNSELEKIVGSTGGRVFSPDDADGIADFARTRAKRVINSRDYVRWPFVGLAVILFLFEIFIRRIIRKE